MDLAPFAGEEARVKPSAIFLFAFCDDAAALQKRRAEGATGDLRGIICSDSGEAGSEQLWRKIARIRQSPFCRDISGRMATQVECTNSAPKCQGLTQWGGFDGANNVWFGGRQVMSLGNVVVTDRLGSVRSTPGNNEEISYRPYGEEQNNPVTADGRTKFGTYYRDRTVDNQDYADQRYHNPWMGRFNSADSMTGNMANPTSWNKYAMVNHSSLSLMHPKVIFTMKKPPMRKHWK